MAAALVSVYVRPEGAYVTVSDRTTAGVWIEAVDWEFVLTDSPEVLGEVILRRLQVPPRTVRHPGRDEFSTLRAEVIAPLLVIAGVKSWRAFISEAVLVDVRRSDVFTVSPMRRNGRGFSALVEAREELIDADAANIGGAVLRAAGVAAEHEGR